MPRLLKRLTSLVRSAKRALLRLAGRPVPPTRDELCDALLASNRMVDELRLIADAAAELIDAMWLFDIKGNPAITIKTDDIEAAHTISHRLWELQALVEGDQPPVPVFIEGTIH